MPRLGTDLEKENYTMALQQGKYMKKSRRNLYIALEELGLVFDESEVIRLQAMWKEDKGILEIAALIMDQADKNKIKSRPMGLGA
ncbi:helix-turn-helix domain-containing protein [Bacillus tropicus]|uniref:helix-turn-helix domain-containing protein n=1 Tax=Bacillus tropicus TaxID=2026188 RepID=UPI00207ACF3C|nr:helix-turn-helix domain-containing protein [Bacillus tropicus]USK99868.1 helix-turn-helix domain-containing protein [Bacillus tropicus]